MLSGLRNAYQIKRGTMGMAMRYLQWLIHMASYLTKSLIHLWVQKLDWLLGSKNWKLRLVGGHRFEVGDVVLGAASILTLPIRSPSCLLATLMGCVLCFLTITGRTVPAAYFH